MRPAIPVPRAFLDRARSYVIETGSPLLRDPAASDRTTVYACSWSAPEYQLSLTPADVGPYDTWRECAAYHELTIPELLQTFPDLSESALDESVGAAVEPEDPDPGIAGVYWLFECLDVSGDYRCAEMSMSGALTRSTGRVRETHTSEWTSAPRLAVVPSVPARSVGSRGPNRGRHDGVTFRNTRETGGTAHIDSRTS